MSKPLTDILKARLKSPPGPIEGPPPTTADAIVDLLIKAANKGDVEAMRVIWERIEDADSYQLFPALSQPSTPASTTWADPNPTGYVG